MNVRAEYRTNIIGVKDEDGLKLMPGPGYVFRQGEHLMVMGHQTDIQKIVRKL